MKRKEHNCIGKSTSGGTNGERGHMKIANIEDLVKRKEISYTVVPRPWNKQGRSSTMVIGGRERYG